MSKTGLIIQREYLTRVRKKSFIIMTILGPLLFAGMIILPAWFATFEDKGVREIAVVECDTNNNPVPDSLQVFRNVIPDKENMKFTYLNNSRLPDILKAYEATQYDGVLYLPQSLLKTGNDASVEFYYRKAPGVSMEDHISKSIEKFLFKDKLKKKNIPAEVYQSLETKVSLSRVNWKYWPNKQEDTTDVKRGLGYISGFLIYMFIFLFGAQVMRGVLEEKTSRIVEVIVSSVSPFQLMMGKIVGIGLTGLTQFLIWVALTFGISFIAQQAFMPTPAKVNSQLKAVSENSEAGQITMGQQAAAVQPDQTTTENQNNAAVKFNDIMRQLREAKIFFVILAFLFYFLGGYLLYGSLFAAIGAASDSETDTQQFMLPITIPLIIGLFVMINSFLNPSGQLAVWFSIIPLTSPIVMMARIPFEVPVSQLLASAAALILTFLFTTWMAAKIYRTGILMYGKKVTYGEMWKWIRYKS
jgi:ABC-2 type transport system permease protein